MPDWLDYQELAASIYSDLSPGARVVHNDSILGRRSGAPRQIDVSIRADIGGHELLVIVQAKHLKRRADMNIVGELQSVVEDVGASKGVLISSSGFSKNAMRLATSLNIDLCTVHDAKARKWALDLRMPLLWIEPAIDFALDFELRPNRTVTEAIQLSTDAGTWRVSRDDGATSQTLSELLCAMWEAPSTPREPGVLHRLQIDCTGLRLFMCQDYWCPLERLEFEYTIHVHAWQGTFTFSQCRGVRNVGTGQLRAKAKLTSRDIPTARDATWQKVGDLRAFEAAHPNLLRVESSVPTPRSLPVSFTDISLT